MTLFPFFLLPRPAFDAVYKCLDVHEIISLSQCSRRSRRIVTCQESPKYGRRIQVTVGKLSCSVAVGEPGARESEGIKGFTWRLSTIRDNKLADVVEFIDRNVNGAIWKVGKSRKGWISVPDDKCMERDLLILLDMFKSIFNCPIHRITLDFGNDNFDPLLIETDALHRAENITIMSTALSHQEADFLFDNLITDKLVFHGYAGKKYVYQKPLNFSKILISCAGWINFEKLMQMANTCKSIDLQTATQISDNDLNQFIKIWIDSDNKTLETVTIVREPYFSIRSLHRRDPVEQFQRPAIMSGINARQGCKKRPDAAEYYSFPVKYQNGLDIQRKDGVWATVLIEQEAHFGKFIFTVWYDKNPHLIDDQ